MPWSSDVQKCLGLYNREITSEEFAFALPLDTSFVVNLFRYLNVEGRGTVPLQSVYTRLKAFDSLSAVDQLRYIFRVVDEEGSGLLDMAMLRIALDAWCHSLSVNVDDDKMDAIVGALFASCVGGLDDNIVSVAEVMMGLQQNPKLLEVFSGSVEKPVIGKDQPKKPPQRIGTPRYFKPDYLWFNRRKVAFIILYLIANIALVAYGAFNYRQSSWFIIVARGCGMALNFNCAYILVLSLRTIFTYLRGTFLAKILPLDQQIFFHRVVGVNIGMYAVIHAFCHVCNVLIVCRDDPFVNILEYLFLWRSQVGYLWGSAYFTGWILFVILFLMVFGSIPWIRHRHFKIFSAIHLLAIPFIILCILHGCNFWRWMLLPGTFFILEKIWNSKLLKIARYGNTCIKEAHLLPNGVVRIVMMRPRKFKFKPGDYILMQMPNLSKYEWHPFSISSPPEEEDISCHVRSLGDWTKRLYDFFNNNPNAPTQEYMIQEDGRKKTYPNKVRFSVDVNQNKTSADFFDEEAEKYSCIVPMNEVPSVSDNDAKTADQNRPPLPTGLPELIEDEKREDSAAEESDSALTTKSPLLLGKKSKDTASRRKTLLDMSIRKKKGSFSISGYSPDFPDTTSTQTSFEVIANEVRVVSKVTEDTDSLRVYIDGPYGTPTRRVFEAEHAVLIATGIGITPYASVIQSIMHRYRRCRTSCPRCQISWPVDETLKAVLTLRKVDLIWINREQRNFEWFVSLLSELEAEMGDDKKYREFVNIHLYMTSDPCQSTLQDVALQAALDQMCKHNTSDVITGLRTRTKLGRPNWDEVFSQIRDEGMGKVSVFFCGPNKMAAPLKKKCVKYQFKFSKESF